MRSGTDCVEDIASENPHPGETGFYQDADSRIMSAGVNLSDVADAIDSGQEAYVDLDTGKIIYRFDGFDDYEEVDDGHDTVCIFFEYNVGYRAMECFIDGIDDSPKAEMLAHAISGKGAFGRFRTAVEYLDLLDEWYSFKDNFMLEKAREWCEDTGVSYNE